MHPALFVLAHIISNPNPAVMPAGPLVLDGCNTASAVRAAEIREMRPGHSDTLAAMADLLIEKDGAICLMESDVLVRTFRAHPSSEIIARTLVVALASDKRHIADRAAELAMTIGLGDPAGFGRMLRRDEMNRGAWVVLRTALHELEPSAQKNVLSLMADRYQPIASR